MKNNVLFLILITLMLSGCAVFNTPHKDFRMTSMQGGKYPSFIYGSQNRLAVQLPGIMSDNRIAHLDCDCASGSISFDSQLRWPHSLYEIWWDTISVQTPCYCELFYLEYYPALDKNVQKKVLFPWGSAVRNPDDYVE